MHTGVGTAGDHARAPTASRSSCPTARRIEARRCSCSPPASARRTQLARDAGLDVGERGGILTDLACRTSDANVYAIGECAAVEGRCYGLVAPGYTTAEIVADRLLGGAAEFPGADLSTKLKLMGVDVASFGDAHARPPGALEVVLSDAAKGTYAKLVVSDDAQDAARRHPGRRRVRVRVAAARWSAASCPATRPR